MYQIHYQADGKVYSDFELENMLENNELVLSEFEGSKTLTVSTGLFIYLVQVCVGRKLIPHDQITLYVKGLPYDFADNGQLKGTLPESNHASLGFKMARTLLAGMK